MATLKEFLAFIQLLVQFRNIRRHYFINTTNIYLARIPSINPASIPVKESFFTNTTYV